ncbi:MAG: aminotransferase class IV [Rhodothermales bacterium]
MSDELQLIETMRWTGSVRLLGYHLARLGASAEALGFGMDRPAIRRAIEACIPQEDPDSPMRLRLLLDRDGRVSCTASALTDPPAGPVRLHLARSVHLDPASGLSVHKTTRRAIYDAAWAEAQAAGCGEALLMDVEGRVCEGSRTNLFVRLGSRVFTPPRSAGILPGVYRSYLIKKHPGIVERDLYPNDLARADALYVTNAVWGVRLAISD